MSTNQGAAAAAPRDEARRICAELGDDACVIRALRIQANAEISRMRPAVALAAYRAALPLARKMGSVKEITELLDGEGYALMLMDDFAGSNAAFVDALLTAQHSGQRTAGVRQDMVELALAQGQLDRAVILAGQAAQDAAAGGDRVTEAMSRILEARALFLRGDLSGSAAILERVRQAIRKFHLSADVPRLWRIAHANLNRALGRLAEASNDLEARHAAPARETIAKPLTEKQKRKRDEKLRKELETPYKKWLNEDVVYIITDEEKTAFKRLATDEEREQFIEQFWLRRDPTPDTEENEFKEEHYRRIAYANDHYASGIPGWKTDRGRIYIIYGPPDEIESHPSGGTYERPMEEGGGETSTYPFEQWRYRYLEGIGTNIIIEFVDPTMSGEYPHDHGPVRKGRPALCSRRRPHPDGTDGPFHQDAALPEYRRHAPGPGVRRLAGKHERVQPSGAVRQTAKAAGRQVQGSGRRGHQQDHLQYSAHEGARRFLPAHRSFRAHLRHPAVRKQGHAVPGQGRRAEGLRQRLWARHHHDPAHRANLRGHRHRGLPQRDAAGLRATPRFTRNRFRCRPAPTASMWW
jgi:GWxTD domain-containing protein